ncbi:MAG: hypothetical protein HOG08_01110 [Candidatus Magasanikbacteria bacterium]|nr:hypothetical protein [Candidatus Magasanikbacteria bacterium]
MKYKILLFLVITCLFFPRIVSAYVIEAVPFKSQIPPGIWKDSKNCGQASSLMVFSFFDNKTPIIQGIKDIDDELYSLYRDDIRNYNGSETKTYQLAAVAKQFGFEASIYGVDGTLDWLRKQILNDQPVIVLSHINMDSRNIGHFMVVVGVEDEEIIVHDPGKNKHVGKFRKFSIDKFLTSWDAQDNSYVVIKKETPTQQPPQSQSFWQELHDFFFGGFVFGWDNQSSVYDGPLRENAPVEPEEEFEIIEEEELPAKIIHGTIRTPAQTIHAQAEEIINITALVENTGETTWEHDLISLNVVGGRDANAQFRHPSWFTPLRPTLLKEQTILPGQIGTFPYTITAPREAGTYRFRTQLVYQEGSVFSGIGDRYHVLSIIVEALEEESIEEEIVLDIPEEPTIAPVEEIAEHQEDPAEEETPQTNAQPIIIYGGGGGSSTPEETHTGTGGPVEEENVLPEITITYPTSSPYIITTSTVHITGTANTSTAYMTYSTSSLHTSTTAYITINTSTYAWVYSPEILVGTTTVYFTAWDSDWSVSSTPVAQTLVYNEEEEEIRTGNIIITNPTLTQSATNTYNYTSNTSTLLFEGIASSTIDQIIFSVDDVIVTTTLTASSTWEISFTVEDATSTVYMYGTYDNVQITPTTTIDITVEEDNSPTLAVIDTQRTIEDLTLITTSTKEAFLEYQILFIGGIELTVEDVQEMCANIGETTTSTDSTVFSDFFSYAQYNVEVGQCVWGSVTTTAHTYTFPFDESFQYLPVIVRVRAYDEENTPYEWQYGEMLFGLTVEDMFYEENRFIISEIAWMGTQASANDEWIEIFNSSIHDRNLEGWQLAWGDYNTTTEEYDNSVVFPRYIVDSLEPVVLERTDENTVIDHRSGIVYTGALGNTGEHLRLIDTEGNIIDEVDASAGWFAGDNTEKSTMLRMFDGLSEGNNADSWCTFTECLEDEIMRGTADMHDADGNSIVGSPGTPIWGIQMFL